MRTWKSKYFSVCKRLHISWHWPFLPMPRPWQCMSNLPATSLDTLENSKAPCSCEGLEVDLCRHFGNMCSWQSSHDVLPFFGTIKKVCRTDIKYPSLTKNNNPGLSKLRLGHPALPLCRVSGICFIPRPASFASSFVVLFRSRRSVRELNLEVLVAVRTACERKDPPVGLGPVLECQWTRMPMYTAFLDDENGWKS